MDPADQVTSLSEAPAHDDLDTPHASPHNSPPLSPVHPDSAEPSVKAAAPTPKRRRVTRACDECRRKKIKCDAKQPCTHCTVYSYECTYDQPSNRRRNATPQQVEALENQLKRTQAILKLLIPNVDLNDPTLEAKLRQGLLTPSPSIVNGTPFGGDAHLESMVKATGQLDLDEQGNFEYHGHSSGLSFVRRMREQLGDVMGPEGQATPFIKSRPISQVFDSPRSNTDSPWELSPGSDLPTREIALDLCDNAVNNAGSLLRFIHWPTFKKQVDSVYEKAPENWGNDENAFLPLLYAAMALGTLFAKVEDSDLDRKGYENAIEKGFKYFKASRSLMDIADCRDIRQLQAILFMIMFLQSSAKLSTCYAYIGVALRSALRMGLHRSFPDNFDPITAETRKRVFWVVRKMDTYVSALLGLPHSITDDDIDQEFPAEVDDEYITEKGILPMPEGQVCVMSAANAHTNLVTILTKIVRYVYPLKGSHPTTAGKTLKSYGVSYKKIMEIERDLREWQDKLPPDLMPGGDAPLIIIRVQHLLRLAYAHAQMMLYRPFLHYVSQTGHSQVTDKRSFACAAACVSVSRNIIHITVEMKKRHLLIGAYWFTMYTAFFAILSLVFYALENPENNASQDVMRVAREGKDTLEQLAKRSMAADRCTATLAALFQQLPERFSKTRKNSMTRKRRQETSPHPSDVQIDAKPSVQILNKDRTSEPRRANTYPQPSNQSNFASNPSTQSLDPNSYQYPTSHAFLDIPQQSSSSSNTATTTPSLSSDSFPMSPVNFTDPHFPLADISSVMFPSADPFAYPDQNMPPAQSYDQIAKTFNQNFVGYPNTPTYPKVITTSANGTTQTSFLFNDAAPTTNKEPNPQDSDIQLLGPTPFYLLQGNGNAMMTQSSTAPPQHGFTAAAFNKDGGASSYTADPLLSSYLSSPTGTTVTLVGDLADPPPFLHVPNMNLDQLLGGEEWVGLDRTTSGMGSAAAHLGAAVEGSPLQRVSEGGLGFEAAGMERYGWGGEGGMA